MYKVQDFLPLFKQHWVDYSFPDKSHKILLAVSGGKDSMALAWTLKQIGQAFEIAHCNFQLRDEASDQDEQHVKDWCLTQQIKGHFIRFDTRQKMNEWKLGVQEAARKLRYDWFESLRNEHQFHAIVTAHHANDNVETLLMNLCKGTGISGLHGILPRQNHVIRPLLFATRNMIDELAEVHNIPFREDLSNASLTYKRNAVRHQIIPAIESVFPYAIKQINESIKHFYDAEALYLKAVEREKKQLLEQRNGDIYISILKLTRKEGYHNICFEIFSDFGFRPGQITEIIKLIKSESGHYIQNEQYRVIKDRQSLIITSPQSNESNCVLIEALPFKTSTSDFNIEIQRLQTGIPNTSTKENEIQIDVANLRFPLILRRWKAGDYFYPLGMGMKKKKISKYLTDNKIPLHEKEQTWVLESDKRIVWLIGHRLDERFKIQAQTKNAINAKVSPL